ncbi:MULTISPECIES: glucans biosynthesis glucosyltransferase MdoH [Methylocaldum]|jgi:membrane glycosyltransferase|uniref:glucans biosynthesis glucosyltransferase MdoH n=1 Tax=unclassified Methylocaldum TaxID=2622260 RepID=UPI000A31F328|nr:glucans biosynthesis glucosyltransferase MdoH [Methylocaldum sp. RMAD-M]MBP1148250.1 membrane glycosyltransferase [Methylocaldum sp. RMAD-M]MDV3242180.1 glucans biosynthesis glucosyltransferase MdoH [Methylocaldum sp.]
MSSNASALPGYVRTLRRTFFFTLVTLTAFAALAMITSAFLQNGITPQEIVLLILYTLLILWISTSFWTATLGFWCLLRGGDKRSISRLVPNPDMTSDQEPALTALVMPIYNEDPVRVFAGLRAIYQSLRETGRADEFELFILSDTRDPDTWMQEEVNWYRMCRDFNAHGKIFYRNREKNIARKSGNIEDFCRRWGGRYRYMIVLDADSLMAGETLTKMVDLMEAHPRVALIQSPPLPVNHKSLFARILQFASSLYSDIFIAGINFWQLSGSNYWGHNAIIRMQPFVRHCGLPKLPGREPFGGEILSHDFVEATLLREAGWEVWLAADLKGSYEELPPTLIDYAKRDRRWCQGNLQHLRMVFARGFSGLSRLYFLMGIMSYLSSPLWLLFLVLTGFEAYVQSQTMPVYFFGDNIFPVWPESYAVEMTTVLLVTLAMLFLPKFWSFLLLLMRPRIIKGYGGVIRAAFSVFFESAFSVLTAPVLMLYQSKFVVAILLRRSVGWPPQNRGDHRLSLKEATLAHGGQTLTGLGAGWLSYEYVPDFFLWLIPVLAGLVLAIPVSILSSSTSVGSLARKLGFFLTPEEYKAPRVVELLHENLARTEQAGAQNEGELNVADPGTYSLHFALLPDRPVKKRQRHQLRALVYQLVEEGPETLSAADKRALISDPETLTRLHTLAWSRKDKDTPQLS